MYSSGMKTHPALKSGSMTLEKEIREILESGNYYHTPEIATELCNIKNALDHINLDSNFFATSSDWSRNFNPYDTEDNIRGAGALITKIAGFLFDYKNSMGKRAIEMKQDNEIRQLHHWALQNLISLEQQLDTHTFSAADRIKQFGDYVGVTDRYTGYRNNLTRGSRQPFKMATSWMDQNEPQGYMSALGQRPSTAGYFTPQPLGSNATRARSAALGSRVRFGPSHGGPPKVDTRGYQTIDTLYPRSNTVYLDKPQSYSEKLQELKTQNHLNATYSGSQQKENMAAPHSMQTLSVQEQAGINTTFPGRTEYMTKYGRPPMDIPTSPFNINPTPDFTLHQRPLGCATYDPSNTEYQVRYDWPDSEKIVRLPWLRK